MLISSFQLVENSWKLYKANLWHFVGYAAWTLLPSAGFYLLTFAQEHWLVDIALFILLIIQTFLWLWIFTAIARSVPIFKAGKTPDVSLISKEALLRIPKLLRTMFLQVLILIGGFLLLIIPFVIFSIWYAFAQLFTVLEDQKAIESLSSSRALVQGRFFPVLWRLAIGPLEIIVLYGLILGLIVLGIGFIAQYDLLQLFENESPDWIMLIESIGDVFVTPLFIIYTVLLYQELKEHPVESKIEKSCDVE